MCVFMCVCLSLCLSVCPRAYLLNHTRDLYQFLCMLPMPWLGPPPAGQFSFFSSLKMHCMGRMNFATKDRFGLNLLLYCKSTEFNFILLNGVIVTISKLFAK